MKQKYISIRTKFASATGIAVLIIWSILVGLSYRITESYAKLSSESSFLTASKVVLAELSDTHEEIEQTTAVLATSTIINIKDLDTWLDNVPFIVEMLKSHPRAASIQLGNINGDYFIVRQLNKDRLWNIFNNPTGTTYGIDYIHGDRIKKPIRYYYDKSLELIEVRELPPLKFDPRDRPWYLDASTSTKTVTTSPYVFYYSRNVGISIAKASADKTSVISTDIFLDALSESLREERITPSSQMVLHINGNVLAWSGDVEPLIEMNNGSLRQRKLSELQSNIFTEIANGTQPKGWLINKTSLEFADGISPELIIAVPKQELLAEFYSLRTIAFTVTFIVLCLLVPFTWLLADRLTKPIRDLHRAIKHIKSENDIKGNVSFWLPEIDSHDEIGVLNTAMRSMRYAINDYMNTLALETKSRERVESELNIAKQIQMDLVPGGGLLHQNIANYKIYAKLTPAKAVGGDLYELIPLSDHRFFIAVGDVSDKGVPAALFMSRTVALTKILVPKINTLSALFYEINNQLVAGNDSCMFITLFCAIVDTKKGIINYASAGHNPPVLVTQDHARFLGIEVGSPLGIFEGTEYAESAIQLGLGENLVIYTDGITEAFDHNKNEFSEKRLLKLLSRPFERVEEIGDEVLTAVSKFTAGAPQSDDITILILGHA